MALDGIVNISRVHPYSINRYKVMVSDVYWSKIMVAVTMMYVLMPWSKVIVMVDMKYVCTKALLNTNTSWFIIQYPPLFIIYEYIYTVVVEKVRFGKAGINCAFHMIIL